MAFQEKNTSELLLEEMLMGVPKATLNRLPLYYSYLIDKQREGHSYASSTDISTSLKMSSILVRKDLSYVSKHAGKPKLGFEIAPLLKDLTTYLGYDNTTDAILIGVGRLGRTLMCYKGFERYGLNIVAGFDTDEDFFGMEIGGRPVLHMCKLTKLIERMHIKIGIITVPGDQAQEVADMLVNAGILAIWNFAPVHIETPRHVIVQNVNLAASLAALSQELAVALRNK